MMNGRKGHCFFIFNVCRKVIATAVGLVLITTLLSCTSGVSNKRVAGKGAIDAVSVMGDWQGKQIFNDGTELPLVAQVIALGNGKFRVNLLSEFDKRIGPIEVLDGCAEGATVRFAEPNGVVVCRGIKWEAVIAKGEFSGSFKGEKSGRFVMKKVVRLSPRLETKAPEGAVILFDGKNLEQWEPGEIQGFVNIRKVLSRQKAAAAYLRCEVWSQKQQGAVLELGSDDGVKVWLNGEVVWANNIIRNFAAGQDKVRVTLKEGWNNIMLKVTSGGGPWGAVLRLTGSDGSVLEDVRERDIYSGDVNPTRTYMDMNGGYVTTWYLCGPYKQEGKETKEIFDVVFEPEEADAKEVRWQVVGREQFEQKTIKWKIVDGAMEVEPGSGSIISRKKFTDFRLHIEFRTPFMPQSRGQNRGNSGVYLQGRYEVQILDSYGLEGKDDECGGIYKVAVPLVNVCAAPMQWQSYDITFCAPRFDGAGVKIKDAHLTVVHNGVKIHDNVELPGPTAYPLDEKTTEPGGIYLQDHNNAVQFRNVWVAELAEKACCN